MTTAISAAETIEPATASDIHIGTLDRRFLAAKLFTPASEPRAAVVIHGGTGVPARYYADFAAWLATASEAAVLIYDYRDFGWSAAGPPKASSASFADWGALDQSAALGDLARRFPGLPLRVVGHSLGGQWLAFHQDVGRVDRVAAVASGPVHWREHPWSYIPAVVAFWWLAGPALTSLLGYLPGRAMGLGADLPANVYWGWRRCCVTPGFHRADWGRTLPFPHPEQARFALTIMPVADDRMMPITAVRRLPSLYPQAQTRERIIDPTALGLAGIGHVGAFAARNRACWPLIAAALND